eukprot:jgi/Hompol1/7020/HPOL_000285-RA
MRLRVTLHCTAQLGPDLLPAVKSWLLRVPMSMLKTRARILPCTLLSSLAVWMCAKPW